MLKHSYGARCTSKLSLQLNKTQKSEISNWSPYALIMVLISIIGYADIATAASEKISTYSLKNIRHPSVKLKTASVENEKAQSKFAIYPLLRLNTGFLRPFKLKESTYQPQSFEYHYTPQPNHHHLSFLGVGGGFEANWLSLSRLKGAITLNYYESNPFTVHGNVSQGVDEGSAEIYPYQYRVHSQQVLLEGRLTYQFARFFQPYGQLGVGVSRVTLDDFDVGVSNFLEFSPQYSDDVQHNLSYSFGAGLNFDLSKRLAMSFGYQFSSLGAGKLGKGVIDEMPIHFRLKQSHCDWKMFVAQLTWKFYS